MNTWLLGASALLVVTAVVHSVMGERRIFLPWCSIPPRDVLRHHQIILRVTWHLPSLLGMGQAATLAVLATANAASAWRLPLGLLSLSVGACGVPVAVATRGRHQGGAALLAAGGLIALGLPWQGEGP
jgi:hypothetical protein